MHALTELEALDLRQCLSLLRSQEFGRLVFCENALPAIRPVNFTVHQTGIVIRLGRSGWVRRLDQSVLAFEVDEIDPISHTGWSVVIVGKARLVTDVAELVALSDPLHRPWAPGKRDQVVCVDMEQVTGRRITFAQAG